jgi:hypothetical protein
MNPSSIDAGGDNSGASQPHKHLQLIPTVEDGPPIEKLARMTTIETTGKVNSPRFDSNTSHITTRQNVPSPSSPSPTPTTSAASPRISPPSPPPNKSPSSPARSSPSSTLRSPPTAATQRHQTASRARRSPTTSSSPSTTCTSSPARPRRTGWPRRARA